MARGSGIGSVPSWALLVGIGGVALVLLGKGVLKPAYNFMGTTIRTVDAAGGAIGLGLAVVAIAMFMWAIGQFRRLT